MANQTIMRNLLKTIEPKVEKEVLGQIQTYWFEDRNLREEYERKQAILDLASEQCYADWKRAKKLANESEVVKEKDKEIAALKTKFEEKEKEYQTTIRDLTKRAERMGQMANDAAEVVKQAKEELGISRPIYFNCGRFDMLAQIEPYQDDLIVAVLEHIKDRCADYDDIRIRASLSNGIFETTKKFHPEFVSYMFKKNLGGVRDSMKNIKPTTRRAIAKLC